MADKDLRVHLKADDDISKVAKSAKAELDRIPDKVETKLDVDSSGLDALPGKLGDVAGMLSGPAGIAAAAGAGAAAIVNLAQGFAEAAVQARVTADLTGSTIEDASRLQAVWKQSGADLNDLNDVLLQMNGVLQTSPEMAKQIGVNLSDGADVGARFVEVVGKIQSSTLGASDKAQLMSQMFGEEGVRQVAKLTASIDGPLSSTLEGVSDAQIIDEEEEARAKKLTEQTRRLNTEWQNLKMTLGEIVIGPVTRSIEETLAPIEGLKAVLSGDWGRAFDTSGTDEWRRSLEGGVEALEAADFAGGEFAATTDDVAAGMSEVARATVEYKRGLEEARDAARDLTRTEQEMIDARRAAVDATFAARDADRDYIQSLIDAETQLAEHPDMLMDNAAALDEVALAAGRNADAQAQLAVDQAAARGQTLSATEVERARNASLVNSARTTSGPMHNAIVQYLADLNGIPPEKVSEILADPNYATIEQAAAAIDQAARDREAEITAQALTAQAEADLRAIETRKRTAFIQAVVVGGASGGGGAGYAPAPSMVEPAVAATATGPTTYAVPGSASNPIPIRVQVPAPSVTFNFNGPSLGNRFDTQRAVTKALRAHQRLNGVRP